MLGIVGQRLVGDRRDPPQQRLLVLGQLLGDADDRLAALACGRVELLGESTHFLRIDDEHVHIRTPHRVKRVLEVGGRGLGVVVHRVRVGVRGLVGGADVVEQVADDRFGGHIAALQVLCPCAVDERRVFGVFRVPGIRVAPCRGGGVARLAGLGHIGGGDRLRHLEHGCRAEPQMRVHRAVVVMVPLALFVVVVMVILAVGDAHERRCLHDALATFVELRLLGPSVVAGAVEHHDVGACELREVRRCRFVVMGVCGRGVDDRGHVDAGAAELLGERTPLVHRRHDVDRGVAAVGGLPCGCGRGPVSSGVASATRQGAGGEAAHRKAGEECDRGTGERPASRFVMRCGALVCRLFCHARLCSLYIVFYAIY